MNNNFIDSAALESEDQVRPGFLIAFGVFLYLFFISTNYQLRMMTLDAMLNQGMNHEIIFWVTIFLELIFLILLLFIVVNYFKIKLIKENSTLVKYLRVLILLVIAVQLIQMGYGFFKEELYGIKHYEKLNEYYTHVRSDHIKNFIDPIIEYLGYIIIGLFLLRSN